MPLLPIWLNTDLESVVTAIKEKEIKEIQIEKRK